MPLDIRSNKIEAIKRLRQFTQDEFGVSVGLKEAKDLVDGLVGRRDEEVTALKAKLANTRYIRDESLALLGVGTLYDAAISEVNNLLFKLESMGEYE